jgi:hypothetical protein
MSTKEKSVRRTLITLAAGIAFGHVVARKRQIAKPASVARSRLYKEESKNGGGGWRLRASGAVAGISAFAAIASALFAAYQVNLAIDQIQVATDQSQTARSALAQSVQIEDMRFAGRLSISLTSGRIEVVNDSELPLVNAAIWTLGESWPNPTEGARIDTIRARLAGVGACKTLRISLKSYLASVVGKVSNPAAGEAYLTFQAPSGAWYTVSSARSLERVDVSGADAIDASKQTPSNAVLGDTLFEGDVSSEVELESQLPIGPVTPVTGATEGVAEVLPNGCNGPSGG